MANIVNYSNIKEDYDSLGNVAKKNPYEVLGREIISSI